MAQPIISRAEAAFVNLLQTILGLNPSASSDSRQSKRDDDLDGENGARLSEPTGSSPSVIPTLGPWGPLVLMLLMSTLVGRLVRKRGR